MTAKITIAREGAVLRLALNRQDKKNALDREMYAALIGALDEAQAEKSVRAIVIGGAPGVFTAGNDLQDFQSVLATPGDFPALTFVRKIAAFTKPLVAAVDGDAVGVGTTMLFHCDLVYATPGARFKMPFLDLGLVPEAGASLLAPRRFGIAKASQFLLLGDGFDGAEALRLGLVNALAPAQEIEQMALAAALRLAQKPADALAASRRLMRGDTAEILARIDAEALEFARLLTSPEARARFAAFFAQKRG
jgi:enoyl-CoA hydratase/carnithine racemase